MGKRQLKLWFLRPIINLAVLAERQTAIAEFIRAEDVMTTLQVPHGYQAGQSKLMDIYFLQIWNMSCLIQGTLRKIKDVPKLLERLTDTPGNFKAADFQVLKESISNLIVLRDTLLNSREVNFDFVIS